MADFSKIWLLNPIKFVPATNVPGLNFDDDWAYNQIKEWQKKVCWHQPWINGFETKLCMTSTITPEKLKIYNGSGTLVNQIDWLPVLTSVGAGNVYICTLQLDTDQDDQILPEGLYYGYQQVTNGGSYNWLTITEPIEKRKALRNTSTITYTNSTNAQGIPFGAMTDPLIFTALLESQLLDFLPESDTADYVNQSHDGVILSGVPYRGFKLKVANAPGNPDYVIDLYNRILCLDTVRHNTMLITKVTGAKWEPQRAPGYPLAGWAIDVIPSVNAEALEYNTLDPLIPGIVVVFDENEDLFGGANGPLVLTTDVKYI